VSGPPRIVGTAKVTAYDRRWEELADDLEFEALPRIRSVAERWAGSIAAVTSAFGIAGLVGGRDALSDLEDAYATAAAILFGLALMLALAAIVLAALAAQGSPKRMRSPSGADVRTWYAASARRAANQLFASRIAAVLSVLVLAAGIGITWFAPSDESDIAPAVVAVTTRSGAVSCGELRTSAQATIAVGTATLPLAEVVSIVPTGACAP
jgi:hypothetical protein